MFRLAVVLLFVAGAAPASGRLHRYALILEDAPLAAHASSRNDLPRLASRESSKHRALEAALAELRIRVTVAEQLLANAVFVEAPAEALPRLRTLPGVAFVERLLPLRPHLSAALKLSNVPTAWETVNGSSNAGSGVRIAVIDTGIDQTHPAFRDDGLQYPAGFPKCSDCEFVNRKVIVARSYVDMLVSSDPAESRPDDLSPRDRVGHGTAVAMIAAGRQSTGPAGVVEGVAPAAWLGNYKIFGSPGVNDGYTYEDVLFQALEDAISDGMDIAVLAVGSPAVWGPRDSGAACDNAGSRACDWRAEALENAARLGLAVVVSAGDSPGLRNSVETPGTAPSAITVGATTNSHKLRQSLIVDDVHRRVDALFGDGPRPGEAFSAQVREVPGDGCRITGSGALQGMFALIAHSGCDPTLAVQTAQRAGAAGVILYQSEGIEDISSMRGLAETGIPAVLIGNRDGIALKDYLRTNPNARVTLDPAVSVAETEESDQIASFSSRGPSIREHGIKPEIVAVGADLYTATQRFDRNGSLYDAGGYSSVRGTSFAASLVAGAVALVKQRNPRLTVAQLKSAVVNTANPRVRDEAGAQATVFDIGAGKLDAGQAVRTNLTIEPSVLSFNSTASPQALKICNHSAGNLELRLSASGTVRVVLSHTSLNLPAGACTDNMTVRLEGGVPSPGSYEGAIQADGGAVPLRVPFAFVAPDGVPHAVLLLEGHDFESEPGQIVPLTFKVIDRFGMPVAKQAVRFVSTLGGGSIRSAGSDTDELGIGWADAVVGPQLGLQTYSVSIGGLVATFSGRVRLAPTIQSGRVVNAASGQPGRGFAPGSYISIYGRGLSEVTRLFPTPYLPLSLAGVSVSFDDPARRVQEPGRIHFVSDSQINVQIPWELQASSSVQLKVSLGNASSSVVTVPVATHSPAIFEYTDSGGRVLATAVNETGLVGFANAVRRGSIVSLYVNGLGAVENQPASGEPASTTLLSNTRSTPEITVGSRPAEVLFSGLAPGYIGLYQVNIRIPTDAPSGLQPVVISAGGVTSEAANMLIE